MRSGWRGRWGGRAAAQAGGTGCATRAQGPSFARPGTLRPLRPTPRPSHESLDSSSDSLNVVWRGLPFREYLTPGQPFFSRRIPSTAACVRFPCCHIPRLPARLLPFVTGAGLSPAACSRAAAAAAKAAAFAALALIRASFATPLALTFALARALLGAKLEAYDFLTSDRSISMGSRVGRSPAPSLQAPHTPLRPSRRSLREPSIVYIDTRRVNRNHGGGAEGCGHSVNG